MGNSIINGFMDAVLGFLMGPSPLSILGAPMGCATQTLGAPKSQTSYKPDSYTDGHCGGVMTGFGRCEIKCIQIIKKLFADDAKKLYEEATSCADRCRQDPDPCDTSFCLEETWDLDVCFDD